MADPETNQEPPSDSPLSALISVKEEVIEESSCALSISNALETGNKTEKNAPNGSNETAQVS